MFSALLTRLVLVFGASAGVSAALACVPAYVAPDGRPVNNGGSHLVVLYDGGSTFVTLAGDFEGEADHFGYVMAVPAGTSVEDAVLVDPAALDELDELLAPRVVSPVCGDVGLPSVPSAPSTSGCSPAPSQSTSTGRLDDLPPDETLVKSRRTLGAYELSVLDPAGGSLSEWLLANDFVVTEEAGFVVDELSEQGVWFLAVGVDVGEPSDLGGRWFEPLRVRFDGALTSLPLRLGATTSSGVQDLVITVLDPTQSAARIGNYRQVDLERDCMADDPASSYEERLDDRLLPGVNGRAAWVREAFLLPEEGEELGTSGTFGQEFGGSQPWFGLTRLHLRYTPDQIDEDLELFAESGVEPHFTTFARHEAWLEGYLPVCGQDGSVFGHLGADFCPIDAVVPESAACASGASGGFSAAGVLLVLGAVLGRRRRS